MKQLEQTDDSAWPPSTLADDGWSDLYTTSYSVPTLSQPNLLSQSYSPLYSPVLSSIAGVTAPPGASRPATTSGTGQTGPAAPPLSGTGTIISVPAQASGHMSFTLDFTGATQDQENLVVAAAQLLSADIKENVNINIAISFSGTGLGANGGPTGSYDYSYSTVRAALLANEPNDPNLADLPTSLPDPENNNPSQLIWVPNAEAKALGLTIPSTPAEDGTVTFSTDIQDSALEGVALHELTHALGRVPYGPPDETTDTPGVFDLTRFTAPGVIDVSDAIPGAAAYFSVDGGVTALDQYGLNSDPSDFLNTGSSPTDAFNEFYSAGVTNQGLTQLDLTQLDVLGFNTSGAVLCYLKGTLIRTLSGEVAVEALKAGDMVATRFGFARPIVWIGRQSFSGVFLGERNAPVCFHRGSIGENTPCRDLYVSPSHSMLINGQLVGAGLLVNGVTITQSAAPDRVDYFHIDLGVHDCIFANGAWSESYAEQSNRAQFHNLSEYEAVFPERDQAFVPMCAPQVLGGDDALPAIRAALMERLPEGVVTPDGDVHLLVEGRRLDGDRVGEREWTFELPAGARSAALRSRWGTPEAVGLSLDDRALGFCVETIVAEWAGGSVALTADSEELRDGVYACERDEASVWRWTDGDCRLPDALFPRIDASALIRINIKGRMLGRYLSRLKHPDPSQRPAYQASRPDDAHSTRRRA